jgi:hypothetical protein
VRPVFTLELLAALRRNEKGAERKLIRPKENDVYTISSAPEWSSIVFETDASGAGARLRCASRPIRQRPA